MMSNPTPQQPVQVQVKGSGSPAVIITLLALILLAIVGGGIYLLSNHSVPGVGPPGPAGTWDMTISSSGSASECQLTIQQSGDQLTGTRTAGIFGSSLTGTVSGQSSHMTSTSTVQFPTGGSYVCTTEMDGQLSDADHMSGTITQEADCTKDPVTGDLGTV